MEEFREKPELSKTTPDQVRLRLRNRNLFFGKIFREKNKTLKQLKIKSGMHLVVQFLEKRETLSNTEIVLLLRKRDLKNSDYNEFIEFAYDHEKALPTLTDLSQKVGDKLGILPGNVAIAKYIPHAYDWKYWDPNEDVEIKKKNKGKGKGKAKGKLKDTKEENKETQKLVKCDLRSAPFLLSEGDILGVRDNSEGGAASDDFQTDADIQNKHRLEELRKLDKETKDQNGKSKHHSDDPFKIYTDF